MPGLLRSLWISAVLFPVIVGGASADDGFRYKAGTHGKGELKYVNGVPVLILNGSAKEMGEQIGTLAMKQATKLLDYPRDVFRYDFTREYKKLSVPLLGKPEKAEKFAWPRFQKKALALESNFPKAQRAELLALIKSSGVDSNQVIAANGMFDLKNIKPAELFLGCSSLIIPPQSSATGGILFGRNLDFFHLDYLHQYSLVMVHRSDRVGIHSFASVGFPGLVGCVSGMNDAGLAIASHEVFGSQAKGVYNKRGVPFAMAYRRILEECTTVDEAVKLLQGIERACVTSLVISDPKEGAVIEVTPKEIAVRRFKNRPGVCTNHFCTKQLSDDSTPTDFHTSDRFKALTETSGKIEKMTVNNVRECLHEANLKDLTIQTLIFEPGKRTLHLSIGKGPTTAKKLTTLDLNKLWKD